MSLLHLVFFLGLFVVIAFASLKLLFLSPWASAILQSDSWSIAFAVSAPLLLLGLTVITAWPIARSIHLVPLRLWTPRCPHCGGASTHYEYVERAWPRIVLSCPDCGGRLELFLQRHCPETLGRDPLVPTFCLRWPEFLGLWKRC